MHSGSNEGTPRVKGYTQLANFMVDHQHVVLKQYRQLAVRDLLYLQAELCDLRYDYAQQAQQDCRESDERNLYDREWWHLQSGESRGGDGKQWRLALQIRGKLQEYYAAIKQYEQVALIRRASDHERNMVHAFIHGESLGGNCNFQGRDLSDDPRFPSVFSSSSNTQDLVFIGEDVGEDDLLSRALRGPGLRMAHRLWTKARHWFPAIPALRTREQSVEEGTTVIGPLDHYPDRKLRFALDVFGSAISSIIPSVSIIVLFFVQDLLKRLALVCVFSFIFSICMSVATRARRIEVFGATAAFASVQVVFVGTTNS